jgi:hypothetical protein
MLTLAPVVLPLPFFPLLVAVIVADVAYRTAPRVRRAAAHPATAWSARAFLALLFAVAAVDLARDTLALT